MYELSANNAFFILNLVLNSVTFSTRAFRSVQGWFVDCEIIFGSQVSIMSCAFCQLKTGAGKKVHQFNP